MIASRGCLPLQKFDCINTPGHTIILLLYILFLKSIVYGQLKIEINLLKVLNMLC